MHMKEGERTDKAVTKGAIEMNGFSFQFCILASQCFHYGDRWHLDSFILQLFFDFHSNGKIRCMS